MKAQVEERIDNLKASLNAKVKAMNKYILDQYSSDESNDSTSDRNHGMSHHLSLLQNVSNRIQGLYLMIEETKSNVHPLHEAEWLTNTEKEFEKFNKELDGLK